MPVLGDVCDPPRPPGLCNFSACLLLWPHLHQAPPKVPRAPPPPFRWLRPPAPPRARLLREPFRFFQLSPTPPRPRLPLALLWPRLLREPLHWPALAPSSSEAPPSPSTPLPGLSAGLAPPESPASLSLVLFPRNLHPSPYLHVCLSKPCLLCTFSVLLLRSLIPVRSKLCP